MKQFALAVFLLVISSYNTFGQKKYQIRTVAFYNLENLFDPFDDPNINDEASPMMEIKENRVAVYQKKIQNMAKVIADIGKDKSKNAPVIIGVSEVENYKVLEDLIQTKVLANKNYRIVHYDSPDLRGIDVALLYQQDYFNPIYHENFELKLWDDQGRRIYTRDQLLVSGYLDNELIHIIVNHWPSRRGGEEKSRYKREKAAFLNTQIIEKIRLNHEDAKIILMGDLNDDPINSSLKEVLKAKANKETLQPGELYNPMEEMFKRGQNTLVYRDNINLFDQILVTQSLVTTKNQYDSYKLFRAAVFKASYLTTKAGKYKGYPFRSFSTGGFTGGYSDHYPVYLHLIKEL